MKKLPTIKELKKKCDDRYITWMDNQYRKISIYLTKAFLYTSITPNQISGISTFIGILGGIILSIGNFWSFVIGGMFFIFSAILDRVDGQLARYKKITSSKGEYLEFLNYHITCLAMHTGLVWGVYRSLNNSLVLLFGLPMILFNISIKHTINGYHIMVLYDIIKKGKYHKHKKYLKDDKKLFPERFKNIGWEINAIITDNDYIGYWIIIGAILDVLMPKITIYSFSMSYLMLFILFQLFVGFLKLIVTLKMFLFQKKNIKKLKSDLFA